MIFFKILALCINEVRKELRDLELANDLIPAAKSVIRDDAHGGGHIAIDKSEISEPVGKVFGFRGGNGDSSS